MGLDPPSLEQFTISSTFHWAMASPLQLPLLIGWRNLTPMPMVIVKINKSLSMFWPAGNFLLTASQDNCCRLRGIGQMAPKFRKMRSFPTFWTGFRSGVFDTRNA